MTPPRTPTGATPSIVFRKTASERRAAQLAAGATKQAELKAEAAERRRARECRDAAAGTEPVR